MKIELNSVFGKDTPQAFSFIRLRQIAFYVDDPKSTINNQKLLIRKSSIVNHKLVSQSHIQQSTIAFIRKSSIVNRK